MRLAVAFLAPVAVTFAYYFTAIQIMGFSARYYYPSIPFLVVCAALVLDRRLRQLSDDAAIRGGAVLRRLAAVALLVALVTSTPLEQLFSGVYGAFFTPAPERHTASVRYSLPARAPLPELDWWRSMKAFSEIAAGLPAGTRISLTEYGQVGAEAPGAHIVDPLGLHDPDFAHHGFSAPAFFEREPELIWFPHGDYSYIVSEILDAEELWRHYDYYPGALAYGLAVRRDSPNRRDIHDLVRQTWRKTYGRLEMDAYRARPSSP